MNDPSAWYYRGRTLPTRYQYEQTNYWISRMIRNHPELRLLPSYEAYIQQVLTDAYKADGMPGMNYEEELIQLAYDTDMALAYGRPLPPGVYNGTTIAALNQVKQKNAKAKKYRAQRMARSKPMRRSPKERRIANKYRR
jgi:hypothetical protein